MYNFIVDIETVFVRLLLTQGQSRSLRMITRISLWWRHDAAALAFLSIPAAGNFEGITMAYIISYSADVQSPDHKPVVSRLACREDTRLSGKVVVAGTCVKQGMGFTSGWLHLHVALVLALILFL